MSYRLKLILTISVLIALTFSAGGTILISVSFQNSLETETQAALNDFQGIQNTLFLLNSMGSQTGFDNLREALDSMAEQKVGRWQALCLKAGDHTIYQSRGELLMGYALPALSTSQCSYIRLDDSYGQGLLAQSTIAAGSEKLVLTARFDFSSLYRTRESQNRIYLAAYAAVVTLGILAAVVLSFTMTRRLRRLTTAVRKIAGGDLTTRSRIASSDEFGQLSRDFDAMADKLQETLSRMELDMARQESFMGAFAHELKTPMTAIIGFADLLRQGNLDESTRMTAANYIFTEGRRLEKLSFKLLELIVLRKDAIAMKRVWLNRYLEEIERALAPSLREKGIRLVCRAEQARAVLEPDLVKSLLYNLIDNASKAMDQGGIIGVKATAIPGGCQFYVADNGRGMEEKELARITEAFYRVDKSRSRAQGGAGLGLALCKQIVELHNGSIHFDSKPGAGTQVTVTLYGKGEKRK
ncbi:MAG: ATP-binding protein [Candidatus Faecousia sp.]|nr:ATP-binding protein [Candidatus Faecousia sp.]